MNELIKINIKVFLSIICAFTFSVWAKVPPTSVSVTGCGLDWDIYCQRISADQFGPGNWGTLESEKSKFYQRCVEQPSETQVPGGGLAFCGKIKWPEKGDEHPFPTCSKWVEY